jgi:hypothetical protein
MVRDFPEIRSRHVDQSIDTRKRIYTDEEGQASCAEHLRVATSIPDCSDTLPLNPMIRRNVK